jgi:hypothetical protein
MVFEFVVDGDTCYFKDEHGVAEVLLREKVRWMDRPKKRPRRENVDTIQLRCKTCSVFVEKELLGVVQ